MINIIKKLMPLNRSLMGRKSKTLKILKTYNKNLQIKSFRSNEKFYLENSNECCKRCIYNNT